jgi:hypothetical protein
MKVKVNIKSVFEQISSEVFIMNNHQQAKDFITNFISNTQIKDIDKNIILNNVNKCKRISDIQRYICNSLLKYEGMSVV